MTNSLTQRLNVCLIAKTYDRIGIVAPSTAGARFIFNDIWLVNGPSWNDKLPKDTVDRLVALSVKLSR